MKLRMIPRAARFAAALLTAPVALAAHAGDARSRHCDRLRPLELCAERAHGGAIASADHQPDHPASERSADADQPGTQPCEPAVLVAATASAVRPAHAAASQPGAEYRLRRPADRPDVPARTTANVSLSASDQQLVTRGALALAEHRRRPAGRNAGAGGRRRQHRHQPHADVGADRPEPGRDRRAAGDAGRQPAPRAPGAATRGSHRRRGGQRPGAEPCSRPSRPPPPNRAASSAGVS